MIKEFQAGISIWHEGHALTDAALWKNRQLAGNHLTVLLIALVCIIKAAGFDFNIDDDALTELSAGIAATVSIVNNILTVATSSKVGLKPPE